MLKSTGRLQEICERLTSIFRSVVPNQKDVVQGKKRPSEKELASAVELGLKRFYEAARAERDTNRLGVISRARVAFGLQQRLLELGYTPELVKKVLFAMLVSAFVG